MFLQVITVVGGMSICFVLCLRCKKRLKEKERKTSSAQLTLPGFVRDDRRRDLGGRGWGLEMGGWCIGNLLQPGTRQAPSHLWKGREGPGDATGSFLKHLVESF